MESNKLQTDIQMRGGFCCFTSLQEFFTRVETSPVVGEVSKIDLCLALTTVAVKALYHAHASFFRSYPKDL